MNNIHDWLTFLLLGAIAIIAALTYTIGRHAYGYHAMGEIAVLLTFGLLGTQGNYYLQTHTLSPSVWLPAIGNGLLAAAVLHINNIRDIHSDQAAGKRTLANLIGFSGSLKLHSILIILGLFCFFAYASKTWQSLLWLISLPLFIQHLKRIHQAQNSETVGKELSTIVQLNLLVNLLFCSGLWFS